MASAGVSMVDRAHIKSILAEHKLTEEGLVNPENAKKLGEFAGVDAILFGNVTDLNGIELMVKAISTESAKIVAAGRITFPKTPDVQWILNRGVSSSPSVTASPTTAATVGDRGSYQAAAIATKDIGSLRVVLKSVGPLVLNDQRRGIRISFQFTSRETRRALAVAMNAESQDRPSPGVTFGRSSANDVHLRARVLDDRGGAWNLSSPDLSGLDFVRAGVHGRNGQDEYRPLEILKLLRLRDDLGRDADDPTDGMYANADSCGEGGCNYTFGPGGNTSPRKFFPFRGNTFISGSTTMIEPGQSVTVTMSFIQDTSQTISGSPPQFFRFYGEIIVGVVETSTKKSYSLQNLTFDQVSMPGVLIAAQLVGKAGQGPRGFTYFSVRSS